MDDPVLDRTSWTPLVLNGHAWRTHCLEVHAAEGWAALRPNLPNHRPLLLISAGTGLTLMVWQIARDSASSGSALIPVLGWLTILLIDTPIFAFTLRTVIFDCRRVVSGSCGQPGAGGRHRPSVAGSGGFMRSSSCRKGWPAKGHSRLRGCHISVIAGFTPAMSSIWSTTAVGGSI